jgi:hypothetical protein
LSTGLIAKVIKALKDRCGAATEYQHLVLELQILERTLQYLQGLKVTESNKEHVNAIRCMALTCQIPLRDFLDGISKFEATLGPFATLRKSSLRSVGHKARWALFISSEIMKLRTAVGAKVLSINLLLSTHTS